MEYQKYLTKSSEVRFKILETIHKAQKGHIGGALSCADICVALYYGNLLKFDPTKPKWEERDRFILSKGHAAIIQYVILADLGFFKSSELNRLNNGGMLGEHPDKNIPGVEVDGGSLGHGLGLAAGIALANKINNKNNKTVVVMGDGECYEGSVWEAFLFAAHQKLNNLICIIDRNGQCVNDFTENINKLDSFSEKLNSFGWEFWEINGHSYKEIFQAFDDYHDRKLGKPLVIIANTIKGKGVSFMEKKLEWHHGSLSKEKLEMARQELFSNLGVNK